MSPSFQLGNRFKSVTLIEFVPYYGKCVYQKVSFKKVDKLNEKFNKIPDKLNKITGGVLR